MGVSYLKPIYGNNFGRVNDYSLNSDKTRLTEEPLHEEQRQMMETAISEALGYSTDEEKTVGQNTRFVAGINCSPDTATREMLLTKETFGKTGGVQMYHGWLSFKGREVSPREALEIGKEFVSECWGKRFQCIVSVHLNTGNIHCDFCVNSVSFVDGKKLWGDEKAWIKFHHVADRICREHNLTTIEHPNGSGRSPDRGGTAHDSKRYIAARKIIDEAIAKSATLEEFKEAVRSEGAEVQILPNRKYWTITPAGYAKPVRMKNLGEDYTNEAIVRRLREEKERTKWDGLYGRENNGREFGGRERIREGRGGNTSYTGQFKTSPFLKSLLKTNSLYRLYLYYCYRLGVFDNGRSSKSSRPMQGKDAARLSMLTEETRLLCREKISTDAELIAYKERLLDMIKSLTKRRETLLGEIPKSEYDFPEDSRDEINVLNKRIGALRKEVALCDDIYRRSAQVRKDVTDMEKKDSVTDIQKDDAQVPGSVFDMGKTPAKKDREIKEGGER